MWLKQMILDGFKSYATRTTIQGWDPHFNAITGLNGSGKSNILDAICFVLGIQTLSQVRVQNLQQLVYKEGQARVQKASVSLIFDNTDKDNTPIGYEDYDEITVTRQVVVGGRNKFMINGQTAPLTRVKDLFHSVQLDVNNPHFLIMQGRITKVLNMKPAEILGMIQEAAGTKMYEEKKASALKTMQKKEGKVEQITRILEEEIDPQLEKLRREKSHYIQWTQNNSDIQRMDRFLVAYQYSRDKERVSTGAEAIAEERASVDEIRQQINYLREQIEETNNEISLRENQRSRDESGAHAELSEKVNALAKRLNVAQQRVKNEKDVRKREAQDLQKLQSLLRKSQKQLKEKEFEEKKHEQQFGGTEDRQKYLQERIASLESQQLGIGMDNKNDTGSLAQQLTKVRGEISAGESEVRRAGKRLKRIDKEVAELRKKLTKFDRDLASFEKEREKRADEIRRMKEQVTAQEFNPAEMDMLQGRHAESSGKLEEAEAEVRRLEDAVRRFQFEYSDPHRGFDRSQVFGRIGKLVRLKGMQYGKAIEVAAGGRLYNVVVSDNQVGKDLLNKGRLRRRVTVIPLNKIQARPVSRQVAGRAKALVGAEHCHVALELVGFPHELEKAMEFVFGNTFVCTDMNVAKQVAFAPDVQTRCVTLDGEVFSPHGTLTGGADRNEGPPLLEQVARFQDQCAIRDRLAQEVREIDEQLRAISTESRRTRNLQNDIELKEAQLAQFESRMKDSAAKGLQDQISELEKEREELTLQKQGTEEALDLLREKARDLAKDKAQYEKSKESRSKQVKQELKKCRAELQKLQNDLQLGNEAKDRITQEMEDIRSDIATLQGQIEEQATKLQEVDNGMAALEEEVESVVSEKKGTEVKLREETRRLSQQDSEIKKLRKKAKQQDKDIQRQELALTKGESELKKSEQRLVKARERLTRLLAEHDWIRTDEQEFGKEGTVYDFGKQSPEAVQRRLDTLKEEQSQLRSKINHKVMTMFERAEAEYRDLIRKREIVRNDKKKIQDVINELDKKKEDTLHRTWRKVNQHFNAIFSTVLPGTRCKLQPPEGGTVLDGLEVRVGFGDVWKESLSELSGGQRSLLALSLILSLLLFKPAPMYILDEIDAALDLSHTQNIGRMLRQYFSKSQFIVVSLKEGMFQNANVIFRTKFVEGVSAVKRTENKRAASRLRG